jgi:pimeloyl-ACP methyl ester carboxylesterase
VNPLFNELAIGNPVEELSVHAKRLARGRSALQLSSMCTAQRPVGFDQIALRDLTFDSQVEAMQDSHVSDQAWQNSFHVAIRTSAKAALDCVTACMDDFRGDLPRIDVPVLVMQGTRDRIFPPRRPESGCPR